MIAARPDGAEGFARHLREFEARCDGTPDDGMVRDAAQESLERLR